MPFIKTTLTRNDDLLKTARRKAARENRKLRDVINEALRQGRTLGGRRKGARYRFKLKTAAGRVMPGVDLHDRDKLSDLMDGR